MAKQRNLVWYGINNSVAVVGALTIVAFYLILFPEDETSTWLQVRFASSIVGTICALVGLLFTRLRHKAILVVFVLGSLLTFANAGLLLARLYYVAQGNDDAGELFWFLAAPMTFAGFQIYLCYKQFLRLRRVEE